jgi:curved DNA-binding protein
VTSNTERPGATARDYYRVLGVERGASSQEIQQAFRTLARRYHPDVNRDPAAEERFKEINDAYQVLSDPRTRARYDRFGPDFRQIPEDFDERAAAARGARSGGFRRGRRGAAQGGPGGRVRVGEGFGASGFDGSGIDIEDLLGGMFGGRGAGPLAGADQEAELVLTVEEAYRGGRRRIALGDGSSSRTYEVNIPAGVVDGQRIRLTGQGGRGRWDGPAGDLYLVVRIAPHPRYRLSGRDINVDLPVTPWEAVLGATVPVATPGGTAKVIVPPGSSTGRRLRLRGEGMPNPKGAPGDLYAAVKIMVPRSPTARERELFSELAAVSNFDPRKKQP